MELLVADHRCHRVGRLDFASRAFFLPIEHAHHVGLQDVSARNDQVRRRVRDRWLFDQVLHLGERAVARAGRDDAIARHSFVLHFEHRYQIAADLLLGIDHLLHAARRAVHELVGQDDRNGLVADDSARATDRVSQAQRLLLPNLGGGAGSFGIALVAGRNRVPRPATGKTASRIGFMVDC